MKVDQKAARLYGLAESQHPYGEMNKVGANVTWMLPVSPGQLLEIKIASEQQMMSKPMMMILTRIERAIAFYELP